jgi:hypothetical protein
MALLQEIWVQDIQERNVEQNAFLDLSVDHSAFIHNTLVHVPQAGTVPVSVKNRSTLPATVTTRTDTDLTYSVYPRSTDPIMVPDLTSFQLSYDKRQSIMQAHIDRLLEDTAKDIANEWAPTAAGRIVRTSGTASASSLAPSATGTRKAITLKEIAALARMFDVDNVSGQERYLMLHPYLYYELFDTEALIRQDTMGKVTLPNGILGQIFGFNLLVKPTLPIYTGAAARKEVDAAAEATDNLSAIAWQRNCVARALSPVEVFENQKDATYYGDVISARIFCGGAKLRADSKGVGAIVQVA